MSTANTLREVTVTTLSTLRTVKRFEKILVEIICTMNRVVVSQKILTISIIIIQSVSKNMIMLRHLQKGKQVKMHVNCRDQKGKGAPTKDDFLVIIV